jgi:energy-coupling factor transport system permease protein
MVLLVGVAVVAFTARRREALPALAVGLASLTLVSGGLNLLLAHLGADVLFELPAWLPGIGGPLTLEALAAGIVAGLGLAAAILAVAPLSLSQEPHELIDALPAALNRTGSALAASFNLVPAIARSFRLVQEAQLMRGWRPGGPRSWGDVVIPVVLTAIEDSMQLAETMEARAFGSGPRTHYARMAWKRFDVAVVIASAVAALIFAGARLTGLAMDWAPYPYLRPPDISWPVVAAILLLAVPLASRWR